MLQKVSVNTRRLPSPLQSGSRLKPRGGLLKRTAGASLMLTSLVDAFSILVIFLMMNSATDTSPIEAYGSIDLPQAKSALVTEERPTLRIEKGEYFLKEQKIEVSGLLDALNSIPSKGELIIIADREMDYQELNPVIVLGSQAGFSDLKFAVIKK